MVFFLISSVMENTPLSVHQGMQHQAKAQGGRCVQKSEAPGTSLHAIPVCLVKSDRKKSNRRGQKQPAVFLYPHREGEAPQPETGQDQRKLSAERVDQRRGDGAGFQYFIPHIPSSP